MKTISESPNYGIESQPFCDLHIDINRYITCNDRLTCTKVFTKVPKNMNKHIYLVQKTN
jgi:hypothetical protein